MDVPSCRLNLQQVARERYNLVSLVFAAHFINSTFNLILRIAAHNFLG